MESGNKQNFPKYNPEIDNNKSNSLVSWNKYIKTTLEIKISKIIKYSKWEFFLIIVIIIFRKFTKWSNQNESKLVHSILFKKLVHYIRKFTLY